MSRRATELEAAHNNARLLSEMLDCYRPGASSKEDLDLIKELHQSCERFVSQISKDLKPEETLFGGKSILCLALNLVCIPIFFSI